MSCYLHKDRNAIKTCSECGEGVCEEYDQRREYFCPKCFREKSKPINSHYGLIAVAMGIVGFFVAGLFFVGFALVIGLLGTAKDNSMVAGLLGAILGIIDYISVIAILVLMF